MSSLPPAIPALTARLLCRLRPGVTEKFSVQPAGGAGRARARPGRHRSRGRRLPAPRAHHLRRQELPDREPEPRRHLPERRPRGLGAARPPGRHHAGQEGRPRCSCCGRRSRRRHHARASCARPSCPTAPDAAPYEIAPGRDPDRPLLRQQPRRGIERRGVQGARAHRAHPAAARPPRPRLVQRHLRQRRAGHDRAAPGRGRDRRWPTWSSYRVVIERGQVVAAPCSSTPAAESAAPVDDARRFSPEWKTRYDWDSSEIQDIAALQARLIAEDGERKRAKAKKEAPTEKFVAVTPPAAKARSRRRAAEARRAPKTPPPTPPPPAVAPPLPPVDAPVAELCLRGAAGDLVVTQPGEYVLGRAKDAPLRVNDPAVSRRHALIVHDGGPQGLHRARRGRERHPPQRRERRRAHADQRRRPRRARRSRAAGPADDYFFSSLSRARASSSSAFCFPLTFGNCEVQVLQRLDHGLRHRGPHEPLLVGGDDVPRRVLGAGVARSCPRRRPCTCPRAPASSSPRGRTSSSSPARRGGPGSACAAPRGRRSGRT